MTRYLYSICTIQEIIEQIVQHTNQYERIPKDPSKPRCIAHDWYPTDLGEIYAYLAIRIYMTLHVDNEITDYWNTNRMTPFHPISTILSRDRYQELHMRVRIHSPRDQGPYSKVS